MLIAVRVRETVFDLFGITKRVEGEDEFCMRVFFFAIDERDDGFYLCPVTRLGENGIEDCGRAK